MADFDRREHQNPKVNNTWFLDAARSELNANLRNYFENS
jgi:hypothetical protein